MVNNFQVETFDKKYDRDARYHELSTRRNEDGSIGRRGLVKFSGSRTLTIEEGDQLADEIGIRLGERRPKARAVWVIAYPRVLSDRTRKRDKRFPIDVSSSRHRRRSRYFRRHPVGAPTLIVASR